MLRRRSPTGPARPLWRSSSPSRWPWRSPGTEAPATAIAQLGQLGDRGRRLFGRGTLLLTIVLVGGLTMALTVLAVRLHVGIPQAAETQIANLARAADGGGSSLFAFFQLSSGLLLLAAAASSFQAGPGLLKALARVHPRGASGLLPAWLGRVNRHHTPVWGVLVYGGISAAIVLAAGGQEQELVLVYAVAVFVSFLAGLLAMARFSYREGSLLLTGALYRRWVAAGRPAGLEAIERYVEED